VNLDDDLAVIASQAGLTVALSRVLWVLTDEDDVAAQVAGEDGVRIIGVPFQRKNTEQVTA
jgi:hypothetical protein